MPAELVETTPRQERFFQDVMNVIVANNADPAEVCGILSYIAGRTLSSIPPGKSADAIREMIIYNFKQGGADAASEIAAAINKGN